MLWCDSTLVAADIWNFHPCSAKKSVQWWISLHKLFSVSNYLNSKQIQVNRLKDKSLKLLCASAFTHFLHLWQDTKQRHENKMNWNCNWLTMSLDVHSLYHPYLSVYVKCTWEFLVHEEKHFSFHHSCTFYRPKEASLRAARCPEDGLDDDESSWGCHSPLSLPGLGSVPWRAVCDLLQQ